MLRLRDGIRPGDAAARLRQLANAANNLASWGSGPDANQWRIHRDKFLTWADDAERHLRSLSNDIDLVSMIHTERYWHIRRLEMHSALPHQLINTEVDVQARALVELADIIDDDVTRLTSIPGAMCTLDTNVLLHCKPVQEIPWPLLLECEAARLLLPFRVIEELDAKKYSRRKDLARRAAKVLAALEELLSDAPLGPISVANSVTVEVLARQSDDERLLDADEEILRVCRNLRQFTGKPVNLATGDTSMKLRARIAGLGVLAMPPEYSLPLPSEEQATQTVATSPN
jgi:hypothetical protein